MTYNIEELVSTVGGIVESSYPDFAFLDPGGRLDIGVELRSVIRIRVELLTVECLHLARVEIDADCDDLAATAICRTSSTWRGYGQRLTDNAVLDPQFEGLGMHTRREYNPWLDIQLERPTTVHRIVLHNRDAVTARRARTIRVRAQTADGRWVTLYDAAERVIRFTQSLEGVFGPVDGLTLDNGEPAPASVGADLVAIASKLHQRIYGPTVVKDLKQVGLSAAGQRQFCAAVSTQILHDREREWTSHGIRRSFRFWSQQEKETCVAYAAELVDDLRELTDNACFGFGSVLSAIRDKDLIPHDDDLDIIVGFEPTEAATIGEALELIDRHLTKKGYTVEGNFTAHRHVSREPNGKVDVFVGIFEGDDISWYPGHRGALRRDVMFPPRPIEFLGSRYPIPAKPETYLEIVYGPTWTVPDPHFHHSWDRKKYADLLR